MSALETRLDRFTSSFKTEAELRTALLGLLERMPNTHNVRHTHGASEKGKDIVFESVGAFNQRLLVACVVKNGRITGAADSDEGARTVFIQAEQALDSPISRVSDGAEEKIAQVFIISPYECPVQTVESIKGKLQKDPGRVVFLCGRELLEKFEEYYPEFLVLHSGLFGSYVAELEKGLDSNPAVVSLLFRHGFLSGGAKSLSAIYVRPQFDLELYAYGLAISDLKLKTLTLPLGLKSAEDIQKSVRDMGRLVSAVIFPDPEGNSYEEQCQRLANSVKRSWQIAFEAYRRRKDLSPAERSKPADSLLLKLENGADLVASIEPLFSRYSEVANGITEKLRAVDRLNSVRFNSAKTALESPLLIEYGDIDSYSRLQPSIVRSAVEPFQILNYGEDLLDQVNSDFFITGPAGFGKTSFCRWHALRDLKRLRDGESDFLPIYVQLYELAQMPVENFRSTILRNRDLITLWDNRNSGNGNSRRRFRLYLDGLDEVSDPKHQERLLQLVTTAKMEEPSLRIVVTGREHVAGKHLHGLIRIGVREFDDKQIRELVTKWFEGDRSSIDPFFAQLSKVPNLSSLMRVPLLATLVLAVYKNVPSLPESRIALYEMFVSLLAGGWDVAKNVHRNSEFGSAPKLIVLTNLALTLHLSRRRDFGPFEFKTAVKDTLPGLKERWQELLASTIQDGLVSHVGLNCAFTHLSFQEYLSARGLQEPTGQKAAIVLKQFLRGDDWWREVAAFYVSLSTRPKQVENFIREMAFEVMKQSGAENVKSRLHRLMEVITETYPGAEPSFRLE